MFMLILAEFKLVVRWCFCQPSKFNSPLVYFSHTSPSDTIMRLACYLQHGTLAFSSLILCVHVCAIPFESDCERGDFVMEDILYIGMAVLASVPCPVGS